MKISIIVRGGIKLAAHSCFIIAGAASALSTVVSRDLNIIGFKGAASSATQMFASSGYSINGNGHMVGWPTHTPLGLYYKDQGPSETGLGIVGPADHELQGDAWHPAQLIQFDVSSLIDQGFTDGKAQVGSVPGLSDDSFAVRGSSSLGDPGTQIGWVYDSSSDMLSVRVADFANSAFSSMGALSGDVLPVAFQETLAAVPEMSALFPIVGLIVAIATTQILRRRRIAQLRAGPPNVP